VGSRSPGAVGSTKKGGTSRRVCLEEVTLRLEHRIEHGVSLKPRGRRLHRLVALLHRLALLGGDRAVVDALLVEVLIEEPAARRAAVDVVAVRLGSSFSNCASISFPEVDALVSSCISSSAMRSESAHSCFWTAGGSLASCGGSPAAAVESTKISPTPMASDMATLRHSARQTPNERDARGSV
jgi:hypothetical protein